MKTLTSISSLRIVRYHLLILISLLMLAALQKENLPVFIKEKLDAFVEARPMEKVYVHIDRLHYTLGDTAWFKVYLVDGQLHLPNTVSKLAYVELLSPKNERIAMRYIHIDDKGAGIGDFLIEKHWEAGEYILRAYTQYMRNFDEAFFYQRTLHFWDAHSEIRIQGTAVRPDLVQQNAPINPAEFDFDVQFFPEGGDLVNGLSSVVAFKAIDHTGKGTAIEGIVLDENNELISLIKSIEFGMGFFSFRPEAGKSYRAEVVCNDIKKTFNLPEARMEGYVLKLKQRPDHQIELEVQTNLPEGLGGVFAIGHIRGQAFCTIEAPEKGNSFTTAISTEELPEGIAHFTLFDNKGLPVCERLVFIRKSSDPFLFKVTTDKPRYQRREKVEVYLQLVDEQGHTPAGHFSVATTDIYAAPYDPYGEDIRTYLLLNSDLKGYVENPAYFFEDDSPGRHQLLHVLLMTHGWRRFVWEEVLRDVPPKITHSPQWGFSLTGFTSRPNSQKPIAADLYITALSQSMFMEELTTNADGRFGIHGLTLFDTTSIFFQANVHDEKRDDRKKKKNKIGEDLSEAYGDRQVSIHLDEISYPTPNRSYAFPLPQPGQDLIVELLRESRRIQTIDSAYRAEWSINLDEITVKAKAKTPDIFDLPNQLYTQPDSRLMIDSFPGSINRISVLEFLKGRVPGLEIQGIYPNYFIRIRGNSTILGDNTPLLVLDGVPLGGTEAIDRIAAIPMNTIAYVDVIKGLRTQSLGLMNTGGAILIYTRSAVGMAPSRSPQTSADLRSIQFLHPGFYRAREFYTPAYDAPARGPVKPDYRTTLFWAPNILLDQNGRATISFYTSDKASRYRIAIEGISEEGRPVRAVQEILVDN